MSDATPAGVFEFTTLIHLTTGSGTGWVADEDALADDAWYLPGDEGITTGCNEVIYCTFNEVVSALNTSADLDTAPPVISTGVYFGLGAFEAADNLQSTTSCSTTSSSTSSRWACSRVLPEDRLGIRFDDQPGSQVRHGSSGRGYRSRS